MSEEYIPILSFRKIGCRYANDRSNDISQDEGVVRKDTCPGCIDT